MRVTVLLNCKAIILQNNVLQIWTVLKTYLVPGVLTIIGTIPPTDDVLRGLTCSLSNIIGYNFPGKY